MPSKRLRSYDPLTSGSGGGATTLDVPFARWSEDVSAGDAPVIGSVLNDDATVDDALNSLLAGQNEDVSADDAWSQFILSAYAEDVTSNDLAMVQLLTVDVARTGTPDSDLMFDAWTDQASPTTNHGNATLQCHGVTTTPGSDEQRAYIAIDLTGYSGFTGLNLLNSNTNAWSLTFQASTSNLLVATALSYSVRWVSTKPFTESTVTWNSPPTLGTQVLSSSVSVAAGGGFASYTIGASAATMANVWGNWLLIVFTGPGAATVALLDTLTIKSRDDATAGNRPKFSLAAQRGT